MPAHLRGSAAAAATSLGIKWVSGFPENAAIGLPAISAVVVMNDPDDRAAGRDPRWRPDHRAADRGGLGRRDRGASRRAGSATRAALIGAGVQGHSHLPVIGHSAPGRPARDPRPPARTRRGARGRGARRRRASARAEVAADRPRRRRRRGCRDHRRVLRAPSERQSMTNDWLAPDALVVASRLRDDGRRRGRARRGPVPDRRARPVPGEPRRRPVRRLPGPDRHHRRGDPRGPRRARPRARRCQPPRGRARGRGLRRRDPARARRRWGSAWTCPGDQRPRRRRRRDDGRLDRACAGSRPAST